MRINTKKLFYLGCVVWVIVVGFLVYTKLHEAPNVHEVPNDMMIHQVPIARKNHAVCVQAQIKYGFPANVCGDVTES